MYQRRESSEARVGNIGIGGSNPIRIQSMGTVDTNDTDGCVAPKKMPIFWQSAMTFLVVR